MTLSQAIHRAAIAAAAVTLMWSAALAQVESSTTVVDTATTSGVALGTDTEAVEPEAAEAVVVPAPVEAPEAAVEEEEDQEARLEPGSTVLLDWELETEGKDVTGRMEQILGQKIFVLNELGELRLPVVGIVPLAGLSEKEAAQRLEAEPFLGDVNISVKLLPLEPTGVAALEPFGRDVFVTAPDTFAPATDLPVPPDYVVGPGDTVQVQLYGRENELHELEVTREGILNVPELGPIAIGGLSFAEVKKTLAERVAQQMIGVNVHVTLGPLRSITVFVVGEVNEPGSYTISGLSTLLNALVTSGGVSRIGSLRQVQLKRKGRVVARLDLYDILLRGDTSGDALVRSNDVVFVPPVGITVGVSGEVKRPAIFELKDERTVADLLELGGGLLPSANLEEAHLQRIIDGSKRTVVDLDLRQEAALATPVRDGDVLVVPSVLRRLEGKVRLSGHVKRPGISQWRQGMALSDLIPSVGRLLPKADLDYVLIKRSRWPDGVMVAFSVSLRSQPGAVPVIPAVPLQADDEVIVFRYDQVNDRQTILEPIIATLRDQASIEVPEWVVRVDGFVRAPGDYPLEPGMRVSDLIRAAGKLEESAYTLGAELTRYRLTEAQERVVEHIPISLTGALKGEPDSNLALWSGDYLSVKLVPAWDEQQFVGVTGEVRFAGTYAIAPGEQLSSLLRRAGGLTDQAFPEGAVLVRDDLKRKEQLQLDKLADDLETALAAATVSELRDPAQEEAIAVGNQLLQELRTTEAVGRLIIDLPALIESSRDGRRSDVDVTMKGGDLLTIPPTSEEVMVFGEVFSPTSQRWLPGAARDDYINMSGGPTEKADTDRIYVVRANGAVVSGQQESILRSVWFASDTGQDIRPGDTIVVPFDVDRIDTLDFVSVVSEIFFQLSVGTAAILNSVTAR